MELRELPIEGCTKGNEIDDISAEHSDQLRRDLGTYLTEVQVGAVMPYIAQHLHEVAHTAWNIAVADAQE